MLCLLPLHACRNTSARKRLAVPFRAAQMPTERSEFAQPDVALLLTHLSYYNDGLSRAEFEQVGAEQGLRCISQEARMPWPFGIQANYAIVNCTHAANHYSKYRAQAVMACI